MMMMMLAVEKDLGPYSLRTEKKKKKKKKKKNWCAQFGRFMEELIRVIFLSFFYSHAHLRYTYIHTYIYIYMFECV